MEMVLYHLKSLRKVLRVVLGLVMMTTYQTQISFTRNTFSLEMRNKRKLLQRKILKKFLEIFQSEENNKDRNFWTEWKKRKTLWLKKQRKRQTKFLTTLMKTKMVMFHLKNWKMGWKTNFLANKKIKTSNHWVTMPNNFMKNMLNRTRRITNIFQNKTFIKFIKIEMTNPFYKKPKKRLIKFTRSWILMAMVKLQCRN